ncbi:MAG: sulfatase-like hydrolase/transferase [Kiritimatiellaeota bacterium]|nr:sulfatase-like hydrolase/transferase [Kiritimatiellota bacterium]
MNVVIICTDTLRWDYLGCYGNDWIATPNLDVLAGESALFVDAFAEGLPTIPVRRVLMTGRNIFPFYYHPQKSDMVQSLGWHPLYDEDVTLAEHLQSRGYHTAFFNDVYHMMKPGKNFHRGFDQWFWTRGQEADPYILADPNKARPLMARVGRELPDTSWVIRHLLLREQWGGEIDTCVARTMQRAADWVRSYSLSKPFYLHVETFDPHEPWDPPAEYAEQYASDYGDTLVGVAAPPRVDLLTEKQFEHVRAAYAGEVTLVDRWVGQLLDALREAGRLEDTVVVFTSDHGCMMGEQGQIHKGRDRLRNQVTQVPLLVRHPGGEAAGRRISGFCQHQDIMPTVLSLMEEPVPDRVLGRNLWPQVRGDDSGVPEVVVSGFGSCAAVRTREWNYVRTWVRSSNPNETPVEELYDLKADPAELINVVADHPRVARELAERLEAHIKAFAPLTTGSFQKAAEADALLTFDALPSLK